MIRTAVAASLMLLMFAPVTSVASSYTGITRCTPPGGTDDNITILKIRTDETTPAVDYAYNGRPVSVGNVYTYTVDGLNKFHHDTRDVAVINANFFTKRDLDGFPAGTPIGPVYIGKKGQKFKNSSTNSYGFPTKINEQSNTSPDSIAFFFDQAAGEQSMSAKIVPAADFSAFISGIKHPDAVVSGVLIYKNQQETLGKAKRAKLQPTTQRPRMAVAMGGIAQDSATVLDFQPDNKTVFLIFAGAITGKRDGYQLKNLIGKIKSLISSNCGMPDDFVISNILNLDGGSSAGFKARISNTVYEGKGGQDYRNIPVTLSFIQSHVRQFNIASVGEISDGDIVTLENVDGSNGNTDVWLNGLTTTGAVDMAPATTESYTGTRWQVKAFGNGVFSFANLGNLVNPDAVWLNGQTGTGDIGLVSDIENHSGTKWTLTQLANGNYALQNMGTESNPAHVWLNRDTSNGTVGLTSTNTNAAAQWDIEVYLSARGALPPTSQPIFCRVFDDGYSNKSGLSDAIYVNSAGQACVPDGTAAGSCRKWFGECRVNQDGETVNFKVFNDGDTNMTTPSNAVFFPVAGSQACVPDGTAQGNCRKWFGMPVTESGTSAACSLFNDGYETKTGLTEAIYYNAGEKGVCLPDGTGTGECRKWFGKCRTLPQ